MNRKWMIGIAVGTLMAAALILVGAGAYRAGERNATDDIEADIEADIEVVGELVTDGDAAGRTIVIDRDDWGRGDFFPGFLVFPLVVTGIVLLVLSRRRRWYGPGGYGRYACDPERELDEWHRKAHAGTPPPAQPAS